MDYTEQFIRLNCSLMSDYKMNEAECRYEMHGAGVVS